MRTYRLHEARSAFSKLVDRALAGEPQRVTRYGRDAVVIVSEAEWAKRPRTAPTLGALLAGFASTSGFGEEDFDRPRSAVGRALGADFAEDA